MINLAEDPILVLFAFPHNLWKFLIDYFVAEFIGSFYSNKAKILVAPNDDGWCTLKAKPNSIGEDQFTPFYLCWVWWDKVLHKPWEFAFKQWLPVSLAEVDIVVDLMTLNLKRWRCQRFVAKLTRDAAWVTPLISASPTNTSDFRHNCRDLPIFMLHCAPVSSPFLLVALEEPLGSMLLLQLIALVLQRLAERVVFSLHSNPDLIFFADLGINRAYRCSLDHVSLAGWDLREWRIGDLAIGPRARFEFWNSDWHL